MKSRRTLLIKLSLLLIWPLVFLLVSEVALRLFTDHPINLNSHQVEDPVLGKRMDPDFRGIDDRGFRNPSVLQSADIVTLGDSHTYGLNVGENDSWPARLAVLSGRSVYNFGIGGYGPIHYAILFDEALKLKPRDIVVGLYLPNDLNDIVRDLKRPHGARWAGQFEWSSPEARPTPAPQDEEEEDWEDWLKGQSAIGSVVRSVEHRRRDNAKERFIIDDEHAPTQFGLKRLDGYKAYVDLEKPPIREAFGILEEILAMMKRKADGSDVRLLVVLIPSKERVYFPYLTRRGYDLPKDFRTIERREAEVTAAIEAFLERTGVSFVNLHPALVEALESRGHLYPTDDDDHPAEAGYAVYADAIWSKLQSSETPLINGAASGNPPPPSH